MDAKRLKKGTEEFNLVLQQALVWCQFWKFQIPSFDMLPSTMLCIYNQGKPTCVGFIYQTDSKICIFEWIIADPEAEKQIRSKSLDTLFCCAKVLSQEMGFGAVFVSANKPTLVHRLNEHFVPTDSNMSHFVWRG